MMRPRSFFLFLFLLGTFGGFAQSRPLTEKEKTWIDSLNNLLGHKNPWFDSLMKADGLVTLAPSLEHFIKGDTAKDVLAFSRTARGENHEPYFISFDYYFNEGKIVARHGPEIYLQPGGAIIVDFMYGPYGGTHDFIASSGGKLLFSSRTNKADTVIPGFADPSRKIIIIPLKSRKQYIVTFRPDKLLGTTKDLSGKTIYLVECSLLEWFHSTDGVRHRLMHQPFVVSMKAPPVTGKAMFAQLEEEAAYDTVHHIQLVCFNLVRTFDFNPDEVERIFQSRADHYPRSVLPYGDKKERRTYRRFVRRLPEKRDPSRIYLDPVVRWLYREKRFSDYR